MARNYIALGFLQTFKVITNAEPRADIKRFGSVDDGQVRESYLFLILVFYSFYLVNFALCCG